MTNPLSLVRLSRSALDELCAHLSEVDGLETGGILLGHYTADRQRTVVVTECVGPGPNARHETDGFDPDQAWHEHHAVQRFDDTSGRVRYVGDWHSHPAGAPSPSKTDARVLRAIATSDEAQLPFPVMLIVGVRDGAQRVAAWTLWRRSVFGIHLTGLHELKVHPDK